MNYAYKTKDSQWRRRVWNLMRERVKVHPRDALIIYLAGPENLDLPIAVSRGFRQENLIAVEYAPATVKALRASGQLTIEGDMMDVLNYWSDSAPVDGVIADFCCDAKFSILNRSASFLIPDVFHSCVFAFNFQRGRDSTLGAYRSDMAPHLERAGVNPKHRGAQFWVGALGVVASAAFGSNERAGYAASYAMGAASKPVFTEYYSEQGRSYFDGVVFDSPFTRGESETKGGATAELFPNAGTPIRRSIAAALAHRTRRAQVRVKIPQPDTGLRCSLPAT